MWIMLAACTVQHLHQHFADHKYSAIEEHFLEAHSDIRVNFMFVRSAMENLIASFSKCYSSINLGLALA